ncbi:hypothetical protein NHQ30_010337 [Ciborinia camelliae]|nr:hypothetical protein NHQ30_010337 [Ciborinia camelliae]
MQENNHYEHVYADADNSSFSDDADNYPFSDDADHYPFSDDSTYDIPVELAADVQDSLAAPNFDSYNVYFYESDANNPFLDPDPYSSFFDQCIDDSCFEEASDPMDGTGALIPAAQADDISRNAYIASGKMYYDDFPDHISEPRIDNPKEISRLVLPGQYYYILCGLLYPIANEQDQHRSNDFNTLPEDGTYQIEKFLEITELTPPAPEWNLETEAAVSTKFVGLTSYFPLWEKNAFEGTPEAFNAYREFVVNMVPIIKSCDAMFCNAQPGVHREAIRLRNHRIASAPANTLLEAETCFKSMRIVANCAIKPGRISKEIPWTVIVLLGSHLDHGEFLISFRGQNGRSNVRVMPTRSVTSDILIVNNERGAGNYPFVSEGTGIYLLHLFLPEMGHEFDVAQVG